MTTTVARRRAVFHPLKVAAIEAITDDSVAITFAVPPELARGVRVRRGPAPDRSAVPGTTSGAATRSARPAGSGVLRIGVKRIPGGEFSAYAAHELKVGDELEVMTPLGRFGTTLDPANAKHYAFVAAGSGITPVLSLVATILAVEPASRVTLLYGNRTAGSVMFADELADLKDRYADGSTWCTCCRGSRPRSSCSAAGSTLSGCGGCSTTILPVDERRRVVPVRAVRDGRRRAGVAARRRVWRVSTCTPSCSTSATRPRRRRSRRPPVDEDAAEVTVILDGRRSSFPLAEHSKAVLDATLAVRSDAPFACKGGVCGTCRAKVIEGSVRMDTNWALEPDEIRAGYVLTCQSHPTTPKVTLDFDA